MIAPNDRGGAIEVLVHYWLKKLLYEKSGEPMLVPEYNLEYGAAEALAELIEVELSPLVAFELGVELSGIVTRMPMNAEDAIRAAVDRAVQTTKKHASHA